MARRGRRTAFVTTIRMTHTRAKASPTRHGSRGAAPVRLLDGERIGRRADCTRDRQRRRDEQEFVALVLGAVVRKRREIENLAYRQAHYGDGDPVPGLVGILCFVGAHLGTPGVGGDAGDLPLVQPIDGLEGQAGRVAAGIAVPALARQAARYVSRVYHQIVAAAHAYVLFLLGVVEYLIRDGEPVGQPLLSHGAGDVKQYSPAHHLFASLLDARSLRAARRHIAAVVPIPHVIVIEDMSETLPLRVALQGHTDVV